MHAIATRLIRAADLSHAEVLTRPAFKSAELVQAVQNARTNLLDAKAVVLATRGKAEKIKARKTVQRAATALAVAEAAVLREARGEVGAPAVQREAIVAQSVEYRDQDGMLAIGDVVLREARIEMAPTKRAELQGALERLFRRETITRRHYLAAKRYRSAWEAAGRDAFPIGLGGGEGGRSAPQSGNRRIENAVGCTIQLTAARRAIGKFGTGFVEHIVIHDFTIAAWAVKQGESEHVAKGVLMMILERLAEHWDDERVQSDKIDIDL